MKLNDVYTKPLKDVVEELNLTDMKVHTDDEPLSHLTNNWRKMHGLPMHRKPAAFRRRRKGNGTGKQSK